TRATCPCSSSPSPGSNTTRAGTCTRGCTSCGSKTPLSNALTSSMPRKQEYIEFVYASLDVLGTTPGRINRRIFDVVLEVWNSGKRLGKMPPAMYDEPEPETPPDSDTDLLQHNIYLPRLRSYNQSKVSNHSDRCSVNYKIEISCSLFNDTFYLPCNVNFPAGMRTRSHRI
ncbi:hypothetical protein DFH09DRAFT_1438529, partial [Mycena vulgaris]